MEPYEAPTELHRAPVPDLQDFQTDSWDRLTARGEFRLICATIVEANRHQLGRGDQLVDEPELVGPLSAPSR